MPLQLSFIWFWYLATAEIGKEKALQAHFSHIVDIQTFNEPLFLLAAAVARSALGSSRSWSLNPIKIF